MKCDLLILNAGQLATCASARRRPKRGGEMLDVGLIENGAVAISAGSIVGVGTTDEITRAFTSEDAIDAAGKSVVPGLVDAHTHIVFGGDRLNEFELKIKGAEYLDILASGGGIISTVSATRAASIEDLVRDGLARLDRMLAFGTTSCEIKTGYGLNTDSELKMLAAIERLDLEHSIDVVPTFLAAHAVPPEFKENSNGYVDLICREIMPRAWNWYASSHFHGRVPFFADVFCEKGAFTVAQTAKVLEAARSLGFQLKAHVDEFENLGGARLALSMGAVSIDHLDAISEEEVELLASSDTIGIVTPAVNFNFGSSHFADARKLIDSGAGVALATDLNPGSAPCPSIPLTMAIACRYQRLLPAEALNAATINGAFAAGLGDRCGSIETGKRADLIIFDTADYRSISYEFGTTPVRTVVKNGVTVFSNPI